MNRLYSCFLLLCFLTALAPFFKSDNPEKRVLELPEWPAEFGGRTLFELPLTDREQSYLRDFPGKIGRFSDGEREIVMRYIATPSRRLHPSADCLRGSGMSVSPLPLFQDSRNTVWGCVTARSDSGEKLKVCEQIIGATGETFSDTSTWFWAAALERSRGPWLAITVAESLS